MTRRLVFLLRHLWFALKIFVGAILFVLALKVFVFASCRIPSWSMVPALIPGDNVLVSKLMPGARIGCGDNPGTDGVTRLWGISKVKRNDVLLFNFPYSDWDKLGFDFAVYYMKRCVAIPGDTFYIENGIYRVKGSRERLGNYDAQRKFASLNEDSIAPQIYHCFPFDSRYKWTVRHFGPLYVPRKGDVLAIDTLNIALYRNLIRYETGKEISVKQGKVYLGKSLLIKYAFRKNYYFMAGDLVHDSKDSRYWGLLPEDHIVGKAVLIWKSQDMKTGKFRWDRFLKWVE
jgi:signal peptidase I